MTLVLVANIVLAGIVFAAILALASWAIRGSQHEGRLLEAGNRRQWARPTISLRRAPARGGRYARPFTLELDA